MSTERTTQYVTWPKGQMRVYAIVFTEPSPEAARRVRESTSDPTYELIPDRVYLVKSGASSDELAHLFRIKGADRDALGVVFKLGTGYAGFTDETLWEWLAVDE